MMQLKEYQKQALAQVRVYLETLTEWRARDIKARAIDPEMAIDWPTKAWEKIETGRQYSPAAHWAEAAIAHHFVSRSQLVAEKHYSRQGSSI